MIGRIYCDANIFIMAMEGRLDQIGAAANLVNAAMDERCTVVTSLLTLGEVLVVPFRFGEAVTIETYRNILGGTFPGIVVRPIDAEVMDYAAALRAKHPRLRLPDAIHLATAQTTKVAWFVSNDGRLPALRNTRMATPFDPDLGDLISRLPEAP